MKKPSPLQPIVIAAPAQAFFHLELTPSQHEYKLSFSVKDETNIRYYVIEGSDDMNSFDWLSRIYPKGNAGRPFTYNASIRNTSYSYYRIRQVDNMSFQDSEDKIETINTDEKEIEDGKERKTRMHFALASSFSF